MTNNVAGISIMAFAVSVAISVGYQFVYIPQATATPVVLKSSQPAESVNPIAVGSHNLHRQKTLFLEGNDGALGLSNKFIWTNEDSHSHSDL
jgi:hypothetical protein